MLKKPRAKKKKDEAPKRKKRAKGAGRPKIRGGIDVNNPPTKIPPMIEVIDDRLVGTRVWFFNPKYGVQSIVVTGVYSIQGRSRLTKWGLWYDDKKDNGKIYSKTLWVREQPLFKTRQFCMRWVRALLEKSKAEMKMNKAIGLE